MGNLQVSKARRNKPGVVNARLRGDEGDLEDFVV
jgi:hypothetical protein